MSGICSRHQGHDPECKLCQAIPLTEHDKAYYEGWDARLESIHRNGWVVAEDIVMDAYETLESAVRSGGGIEAALAKLDELRQLKRVFRA